jgi:hypothetical protein
MSEEIIEQVITLRKPRELPVIHTTYILPEELQTKIDAVVAEKETTGKSVDAKMAPTKNVVPVKRKNIFLDSLKVE